MKYFLVLLCIILASCGSGIKKRNFDSQLWKTGDRAVRGSMVDDLSRNVGLTGKDRAEIKDLLGEPDEDYGDQFYYTVDIGEKFFYETMPFRLRIDFNPAGKAVLTQIRD